MKSYAHPLRAACILAALTHYSYADEANHPIRKWWSDHAQFSIKNLSYGYSQEFADITLNPDNLLNLPRYTIANELRPELSIDYERFYFDIKPRFTIRRDFYDSGTLDDTSNSDTDTYINEWTTLVQLTPEIALSYGREDLQWGPSFLLSPSNPFDSDNGRSEPKGEVAGAEYAKLIWTPNYHWTVSLIVNTHEGRKAYRLIEELAQDFRSTYTLKTDYLFDRGNASIILSTMEDGEDIDDRAGYYLSYNLSDAWIGYSEGSFSTDDTEMLLGGSYTSDSSYIFSIEYFHNSSGLADEPIPEAPGDLIDFSDYLLSLSNREKLFRENYLLLQAYKNDIFNRANALLRYTQNLDDDSHSLLGHLEINLNDYAQLFTSATLNSNGGGELDSLRKYWVQVGIELSF